MKNLENLRLRRDYFFTFLWLRSSMSWCQAATVHRMFCYGEMAVEKRLFWKNQYGLRLRVRSGFVFKKVGVSAMFLSSAVLSDLSCCSVTVKN